MATPAYYYEQQPDGSWEQRPNPDYEGGGYTTDQGPQPGGGGGYNEPAPVSQPPASSASDQDQLYGPYNLQNPPPPESGWDIPTFTEQAQTQGYENYAETQAQATAAGAYDAPASILASPWLWIIGGALLLRSRNQTLF